MTPEQTQKFLHPFTPQPLLDRRDMALANTSPGDTMPIDWEAVWTKVFALAVISGVVGVPASAMLGGHPLLGTIPGVLLLTGFFGLVVALFRLEAHANRDLRAVQAEIDRDWTIEAPRSVAADVATLVDGLAALPAGARVEFRPMVDAVTDACALLRTDPTDGVARARIAARATAVADAVTQARALESELRRQEVAARHGSTDDADLAAARAYSEALAEARAAVAGASPAVQALAD